MGCTIQQLLIPPSRHGCVFSADVRHGLADMTNWPAQPRRELRFVHVA